MIAKCLIRAYSSLPRVVGYNYKASKGYILESSCGYKKDDVIKCLSNNIPDSVARNNQGSIAHIFLRLPDGERLDDETFRKMGNDYLKKMNFEERDNIIIMHNDIKNGQHIHIITSLYNDKGKRWDDKYFKYRSETARIELEEKYNLTKITGEKKSNRSNKLTYKDFASELRRNTLTAKSFIQQEVKSALWGKKDLSLTDFVEVMNKRNIEVTFNLQNQNTKIAGVSFHVKGEYNEYTFKGSQIGKYSYGDLVKKLNVSSTDIAYAAQLKRYNFQDTETNQVMQKNTKELKNDILSFANSNDITLNPKVSKIFDNARIYSGDVDKIHRYLENCKGAPGNVRSLIDYVNSEHVSRTEKNIDRILLSVEKERGKSLKTERSKLIKLFDAYYFSDRCNAALKSYESFQKSGFCKNDLSTSEHVQSTLERNLSGYHRSFNEKITKLFPPQYHSKINNLLLTEAERSYFKKQDEEGRGDTLFLEKVLKRNETFITEKLYNNFEKASLKGNIEFSPENFAKILKLASDSNFHPKVLSLEINENLIKTSSLNFDKVLPAPKLDDLNDYDNTKSLIKELKKVTKPSNAMIDEGENEEVRKRKRNQDQNIKR